MTDLKTIAAAEVSNLPGSYKTTMTSGRHTVIADEPPAAGGDDEGPAPGDYLCMALAACKTITIRMYVQRKGWDAGEVQVKVSLTKSDAAGGPIHTFTCGSSVTGNLSGEQKERLVYIAKACPISRLISKPSVVVTVML